MLNVTMRPTTTIRVLRPWLRRAHGRTWPLALARHLLRSQRRVRRTPRARRRDDEAKCVRALALLPAIYLEWRERFPGPTTELMHGLLNAVLEAERGRVCHEPGFPEESAPRARWHAFFGRITSEGSAAFNEEECLSVQTERFHVRVRRCLFAELAQALGLPELARMACDANLSCCGRLLPGYEFHRNHSERQTLGYGFPYCDYVWEREEPPAQASRP